ncbi:phage tail assembly chaperone G [Priestia aryabhattai]|uniref:Tail assembly chaperone n=1 Tax=Priestia aryabhattai TaxID=412384 RepID=A0ABD7X449_PRIAR|nr:hypothetical protein [Priestia aryabhattai]WEA47288.1 hypothetical protein PWO00_28640 [Priestia aryabhattai]
MKITLHFPNENPKNEKDLYTKKTFNAPFIPLIVIKTLTEMREKSENDLQQFNDEELEQFIDLVCITFVNQFTSDDFYRGMATDKISEFITEFHDKAFNIQREGTGSSGKK